MPEATFEPAAVARLLAQVADRPDDRVEAFFEHRFERTWPPADEALAPRVIADEGFAVRLVRGGRAWQSSRDGFSAAAFVEAARQVARAQPRAALVEPAMPEPAVWNEADGPWREFPRWVERALRAEHVAFPLRLLCRQHARRTQVVGPRLVSEPQRERFASAVVDLPWGRSGLLAPELTPQVAQEFAARLAARFRARFAASPAAGRTALVFAPDAAAVLLHEAVAHTLEVDILAQSGNPEAAVGVALGARCLNVLDSPAAAPETVRRSSDDEGSPVVRRWLLREGVVEQPLADGAWADSSAVLLPGAARRAHRHTLPGPRSSHLELLAGEASDADLLAAAEGGLWVAEVEQGTLDSLDGSFLLTVGCARRITRGELGDAVGPFRLRASVLDLLSGVALLGREARAAGAGWCAKGGQALPVWAHAPSMLIEGLEVSLS